MKMRLKSRSTNGLQKHVKAVKSDLASLQDDLIELAEGVGKIAEREISSVAGSARTYVSKQVGEWSNGNMKSMRTLVRSQPIAACALSIGAGALVGAWLLRR